MKFFESFRRSKKTDAEVDAEYVAAHKELQRAVEDMNMARTERDDAVHKAEQVRAQAKESLERSLKELENLNP